ncbi:translation initiation factor IF-2 [Desulfovibrio sp. ZJ209]|uniref:translation initiation factor IF-2 n=2 Tax=unclassified Desulfovibrio TaxID=2593640 RepID=UPI0013EAF77D|nr:translation initiation factor IF-2 [Desulfovibrio sp. ZJ209]
MAEIKIKVKDLASELGVPTRDMLPALRELGVSAKSMAGSVDEEEAGRLRAHFAARKESTVERTTVQPNVIVRRRRKEAPAPEAPAAPPAAEAAPEPEAARPAEAPKAAKAEAPEGGAAPRAKAAPAPEAAPEAAPKAAAEAVAGRRPAGARVISRPGEAAAAAPKAEAPKAAAPAAEAPKAEGAKADAAEPAAQAPQAEEVPAAKPAEAAIPEAAEKAEAPGAEESVAPEQASRPEPAEKSAKLSRIARPDASAVPEGSSAPTLPPRSESRREAEADAEGDERARGARQDAAPQVRIISRPAPGSQPRPASQGAPGSRGGYRDGQRPGGGYRDGQRPGPSGAGRPGGYGAPRPGAPGFGQPAPGQADSRDGQSKKKRLKGRRTVDFQQGDFGRHGDDEEGLRLNRGRSRRKGGKVQAAPQATQPIKAAKRKIRVTEAIRVADMAHQMGLKANEIIKVLFGLGVMATINQSLDIDTATLVAAEFGYEVEKAGFSEEDYLVPKEADAPESLKPRPPVVTIMGHVDHGKTSLLDAIRKSNVTSGEAGGITQHIGAYHVKTKRGEIVFLDTPGHEAFTAMRARGAQVTDLVILVVAADDGVMEQTREAINHSRAANVPIMVAVNKMDKPGADPDRVLRELAELGLQPEDWGGDTVVSRVSAKTREGLDDLLELVALQSEIMDLKANPDKPARGHIVEARLDKGRGPVATVLIQEGTLRLGDNFVCGPFSGRVRALTSDQGKKVKEAGPSIPVEVQGFEGVPEAGEEFFVVADDKLARRIADSRAVRQREHDLRSEAKVTLETFLSRSAESQEAQTLNLVLKADVQGSLEAITEALNKLSTDKVKINVVHGGTGAISESDILLASASQAIIIGFNVRPAARIKDVAERENVDIRFYDIIYKLVDDIKSAMAGMLAPVHREVYLGQAEVRETFSVPKVGIIAGSYVSDGKIARNAGVRLLRDGVVIYTGKIASLKRFKDDAREVVKGNECGVGLENFNDVKVGDIIEAFETVEEAATL